MLLCISWFSLGSEMERVKNLSRKGNDCRSTVVFVAQFILQIFLFILFLNYFGVPSVQKYLDMETIVISAEEQTNGIEAPAITLVALRKDKKDSSAMRIGWKSIAENLTPLTFSMFDHCQGMNFTDMNACLKNDTTERDEFLKSARLGFDEENSTSFVDKSSSSMWSEDMTATFVGRHFTLKPSMTIAPSPDDFLTFKLGTGFHNLQLVLSTKDIQNFSFQYIFGDFCGKKMYFTR